MTVRKLGLEKRRKLGLLFKTQRKRLGLTQEYIAEKMNISEKHYSKIEAGMYMPNLTNFFKLADILELDIGEFNSKSSALTHKEKDIMFMLKDLDNDTLEICSNVLKTLIHELVLKEDQSI